jgi:Icc protein
MSRRNFLKWLIALIGIIASVVMDINGLELINKDRSIHKASAAAIKQVSDQPALDVEPVKAQSGGRLLLSLFLLSDLHVSVFENISTRKLKQALNDITAFESPVDAIVFGGDLTDYGQEVDYKRLSDTLIKYKLPPYYGNMGNHEYYDVWVDGKGKIKKNTMPNGKKDHTARDRFQKFIGYSDKIYHDVWLSGVHLIMLSQETYRQEMKNVAEGAWYSDAQMDWFKTKMLEHQDGKPALIFIHQPLPAKGKEGSLYQLIRATEFRDIVKPYKNVFVFSGHTHRNFNEKGHYVKESFDWIINASVGRTKPTGAGIGAFRPTTAAQGCYIQVYEHKIVVRGREFSNRSWIAKANWSFSI